MVTTIDLLISLGIKIAEIIPPLLERRANKEEKKRAQELVERYNQVKETHSQLENLVRRYNQAVERTFVRRGVQELFSLCTFEEYQRAEQRYESFVQHQISYQKLVDLDILSISLIVRTIEEFWLDSANKVSDRRANVYTREKWVTLYQNGVRAEQDVVNCYRAAWSDNAWKIAGSEVFTQAG